MSLGFGISIWGILVEVQGCLRFGKGNFGYGYSIFSLCCVEVYYRGINLSYDVAITNLFVAILTATFHHMTCFSSNGGWMQLLFFGFLFFSQVVGFFYGWLRWFDKWWLEDQLKTQSLPCGSGLDFFFFFLGWLKLVQV